jgi:hypothetical protein
MMDDPTDVPRPAPPPTPANPGPLPRSDEIPPSPLTPEEQMALFEKELKENDWGHQPC